MERQTKRMMTAEKNCPREKIEGMGLSIYNEAMIYKENDNCLQVI